MMTKPIKNQARITLIVELKSDRSDMSDLSDLSDSEKKGGMS